MPRANSRTLPGHAGWLWLVGCLYWQGISTCQAQIQAEPPSVQLAVGESQQILVSSQAAEPVDLTGDSQYASSDASIAAVTSSGVIHALRPGQVTIEVQSANHAARLVVTIAPADDSRIRFTTDVVPILTRLGCNSGGCHGKATGQNGFKLSLFGFEPVLDYEALVEESRGRRLFPAAADRSLLLLKATSTLPHGGGRRLDTDSDDYRILRTWIARGAPAPRGEDRRLERIEIQPRERILATQARQQLLVTAYFSDGTTRDVTRQAIYQSNEPEIAAVDVQGLVTTDVHPGLAAVMCRFGDQIGTFQAAVPFVREAATRKAVNDELDRLERQFADSQPDQVMLRLWRRLAIVPSAPADDATLLRRMMIDICGTLPTPEEVQEFLADTGPNKRGRWIDRLLERPEYASYFALKWADILQNRGAGYSTSRQRAGTTLFAGWIRDSLAENKPYDEFVSEILCANGSQNENPPTIWYRTVRKSPDYVESFAQAFLGVRIQCAQCHHHPAERWSQADYYGLASVFARVGRKGGFADAEVPTDEIIFLADHGQAVHPRTGLPVPARALGGPDFALGRYDDPRRSLARWMTDPSNPYFARTIVNRLWAHFLGRGIIHPIDDARSTNPPSNPELLDLLAADFISHGYDLKYLIRVICNSHAYGLDSAPNAWNAEDTQSFARFRPRRLGAEVLLDGISQVLDAPTDFAGGSGALPPGMRAIDLPDENVAAHFLDVFGRPARTSACECERADEPSLAQALELVNSEEIQRKLTLETGFAHRLAQRELDAEARAREIFLRVLGRPARADELRIATDFLQGESDQEEAVRSLLWSLLATNEFLFNH